MPAGLVEPGAMAAAVAVGVLASVALLENVLIQTRRRLVLFPSLPVSETPPPLRRAPPAQGVRGGVRWWTVEQGVLGWVAEESAIGRGMRGTIRLAVDRQGRVHLDVRWTPRWLPTALAVVLAVMGGLRGDGALAGGLAALLGTAFMMAQASVAPRVVPVVRQALVLGAEADHSQGGSPS